jgi:hypothetical protein
MKKVTFDAISVGGSFRFQNHTYMKVGAELASNEKGERILFMRETTVVVLPILPDAEGKQSRDS